ncbi:MAG TPA: hypothetical protein VKV20_02570 [Ktedonobacteraceae bacterium]|nr:hypothetical protein [Ktedonobacteraceae bacterium]
MSTIQIPTFQTQEVARDTLRQRVLNFLKLGTLGFGGPVALIGYMQRGRFSLIHW